MKCKDCESSYAVASNGKLMLCKNTLNIKHKHQAFIQTPDWCPKQNNFQKLKRIYELILLFEKEYGRKIALETLEVSDNVRPINTIDDLLEDLENNK